MTRPYRICSDTLWDFGLAQFDHDTLQLIILKLNEIIFASSLDETYGSLLLFVNLPNKQPTNVYLLLYQ